MIKNTIFTLILFISTICVLGACAPINMSSGKAFTISQIQAIEKDKSGKEEVKELFGEPQMMGKDDKGLDRWTFFYLDATIPLRGGDVKEKVQRLSITFEKGIVSSFDYELTK